MLNSRDIDQLRPDVAANCRVFLGLCKAAGLQVLVTATVRDEEYQRYCYNNGTAATPLPSFHGIKAGLAFDICKNVKGHEYDDMDFFRRAGEIGEKIGFEWGGRWTSFPDKPHFQWSQGGKYTSAMVRAGKLPPAMPIYEEEVAMSEEQFNKMFATAMRAYELDQAQARNRAVSPCFTGEWADAERIGLMDGTTPAGPVLREQLGAVAVRLYKLCGGAK